MKYDKEYMNILSNKLSILFSYVGNLFKIIDDLYYLLKIILLIPSLLIIKSTVLIHSLKMAYYSMEMLKTIIIPYFFINHIMNVKKYHDVSKINKNMEMGYYYYVMIFIMNWIFKIVLMYVINNYDFKLEMFFRNVFS